MSSPVFNTETASAAETASAVAEGMKSIKRHLDEATVTAKRLMDEDHLNRHKINEMCNTFSGAITTTYNEANRRDADVAERARVAEDTRRRAENAALVKKDADMLQGVCGRCQVAIMGAARSHPHNETHNVDLLDLKKGDVLTNGSVVRCVVTQYRNAKELWDFLHDYDPRAEDSHLYSGYCMTLNLPHRYAVTKRAVRRTAAEEGRANECRWSNAANTRIVNVVLVGNETLWNVRGGYGGEHHFEIPSLGSLPEHDVGITCMSPAYLDVLREHKGWEKGMIHLN